MRLKEVIIKGFRGYQNETRIPIDKNLTGIVGQNDTGKSSILEALDIFFEGKEITLDKDDFFVSSTKREIEIRCIFDELPSEILLDAANKTSLAEEHFLNPSGDLEILKRYKPSTLKEPKIAIIAEYPTTAGAQDLHTLKISELKERAKSIGIADTDDGRTSASWRKSIWQKISNLNKSTQEVSFSKFDKEAAKIEGKIFAQLPLFALFRSDRESKDSDSEAKNPLQEAVKLAQVELKDEIAKIQEQIQKKVMERATKTLDKLREMDPNLAEKLDPRFKSSPRWTFDFTLDGDEEIPINKRGSGFRRLILLNFFRAEAERKVHDSSSPSVIYAFEEPETSQHPINQEMLVRALMQIGAKQNTQVLLTTHVPALAGLLPIEGLRFVEKKSNHPAVQVPVGNELLEKIAASLGVLPEIGMTGAKALILVEGAGDVVFIRHLSKELKAAGHIPFSLEEKNIHAVPIGGCGNLKHWQTKRIADQFNIPWGILLDSDVNDNISAVAQLQGSGKKAYVTKKREPENYILPIIIQPHAGATIVKYGDQDDAKNLISTATRVRSNSVLETFWPLMTAANIRQSEEYKDATGKTRYELTEIMADFLTLAR